MKLWHIIMVFGLLILVSTAISFYGCGAVVEDANSTTTTTTASTTTTTTASTTTTISISGRITFDGPGSPSMEGVTITASQPASSQTTTTDANGDFSFTTPAGTYEITPTKEAYVFYPASITVSDTSTEVNFSASLEGWLVVNSPVATDWYDIHGETNEVDYSYYLLVGANGKAYTSATYLASGETAVWEQITNDGITSADVLIRAEIDYDDDNSLGLFSETYLWYLLGAASATLPSGNITFTLAGTYATDPAEDITSFTGGATNYGYKVANGELYFNDDLSTNPTNFGSSNLAPAGMTVRSVDVAIETKLVVLIGGDNGQLYSYISDNVTAPTPTSWTALESNTTEKITGLRIQYGEGEEYVGYVTEDGTFGYAWLDENFSLSSWAVGFTGLPYTLNGVDINEREVGVTKEFAVAGNDSLILIKQ
ncbi:carboxypeptidase-like regulatory domain-containing protein [Candidatus Margulisiibacteriota bacterium]